MVANACSKLAVSSDLWLTCAVRIKKTKLQSNIILVVCGEGGVGRVANFLNIHDTLKEHLFITGLIRYTDEKVHFIHKLVM